MLTPILSTVLGAALGIAPASTTNLPPESTTPHVLGRCLYGLVLPSGENYGGDVSPVDAAEWYLYHYTSKPFREANDVYNSLMNDSQVKVEVLTPPKYGKLLDEGNPESGEWYRQGFEGKHLYRYVPNKGHEMDSDRFIVRVTLKSVQIDIQYQMEAVPSGDRPDEYCPREEWKISQIDVKDLNGVALASTTFTPASPFQSISLTGGASGLPEVSVGFSNLGDASVGMEQATDNGASINLDTDAAGYGWFVDSTPGDNTEFLPTANPNEWVAKVGSPAYGKMDLYTVLLHEYSHALGLDHTPDSHDFMAATLKPGVRHTLSQADLAGIAQKFGLPTPEPGQSLSGILFGLSL